MAYLERIVICSPGWNGDILLCICLQTPECARKVTYEDLVLGSGPGFLLFPVYEKYK